LFLTKYIFYFILILYLNTTGCPLLRNRFPSITQQVFHYPTRKDKFSACFTVTVGLFKRLCDFHEIRNLTFWNQCSIGRVRLKPDGTLWRTGGQVKGKLTNGVCSQYSYTTSEHGVSSITTADAHSSAAGSRLNWRPRRFEWTRPFRRKKKSGFCACTITFQTQSTYWVRLCYISTFEAYKVQKYVIRKEAAHNKLNVHCRNEYVELWVWCWRRMEKISTQTVWEMKKNYKQSMTGIFYIK